MQGTGTQLAFKFHLSFQKLHVNLSPFLKSALHALEAFQKPQESPSHFSRANREPILIQFKQIYKEVSSIFFIQ